MASTLAKAFNALTRKERIGPMAILNEWHFDIRYIALEPTPSHILTIVQPESRFIHTERLPLGLSTRSSGIAFFPETAEEAASEIAKGLLHAFVDNMGMNKMMGSRAPTPYAPWKLTTQDQDLAHAVGCELKRLGVLSTDLCNVKVSNSSVNAIMTESFDQFFKSLTRSIGYTDSIFDAIIVTPDYIKFDQFDNTQSERSIAVRSPPNTTEACLEYATQLSSCCPPMAENFMDYMKLSSDFPEQLAAIDNRLSKKPEAVVKAEADRGDAHAAFDYGLRLYVGLGCAVDRKLSRHYLVKALTSPSASDTLKAACHGILINWHIPSKSESIAIRHLLAGAHHVNLAAALCRKVSPRGVQSSPAVLHFMFYVYERFVSTCPQLVMICENGIRALEERKKEMKEGQEKMYKKRLENPNRYRCAAVGCDIQSDTGKVLSRCSGKCDIDKKPSYCSKTCQKADWKNHKPFCVPGAKCSVVDDGTYSQSSIPSSKTDAGAIQIPFPMPDGSTLMVSSSTMDADFLKEVRGHLGKSMTTEGVNK